MTSLWKSHDDVTLENTMMTSLWKIP
jgi:hypothetical protein